MRPLFDALTGEAPAVAVTKAESAYRTIRRQILTGVLTPGAVLDQEELAASLSLSSTPLREAVRRLESEELLHVTAHHSVRVSPLTRRELEELFVVRLQLETLGARLGAENASDADIELVRSFSGVTGTADPADVIRINRAFHRAIYTASGNSVLVKQLDLLGEKSDRYRLVLIDHVSAMDYSFLEHEKVIEAFARRDGAETAALTAHHLRAAHERLAVLAAPLPDD